MSKFNSDRIENLKVEYYLVIGKLELIKNIVISNSDLKILEDRMSNCQSEIEVAALLLGATRRYSLLLNASEENFIQQDPSTYLPNIEQNPQSSSQTTLEHASNSETRSTDPSTQLPNIKQNPQSSSQTTLEHATNSETRSTDPSKNLPNIEQNHQSSSHATNSETRSTEQGTEEEVHTHDDDSQANIQKTTKVFTNSLNMSNIEEIQLTTTREKNSYFITFTEDATQKLGCEFTFKKDCKEYNRYECKFCRKLVDKQKKVLKENFLSDQMPAAIKIANGKFLQFIKEKHNDSCYVESFATAFSRSQKNVCVQFKGKYGGSAKQAYDIHTRILEQASDKLNITATDIAEGFTNFNSAKNALKKSGQRKSAVTIPNMVDEDGRVDKIATKTVKTSVTEEQDYFLIGESLESGTIVLGSKYLVRKFFESKKVGSDGTFKMAPIGYTQVYIQWSLVEGTIEGECANRSKAIPGVYMFLKGKSQVLYEEAFAMVEKYRQENGIPFPAWDSYLLDDEKAVQNAITNLYPSTEIELCYVHVNKNIIKCLVKFKLTSFIRNCQSDGELWFYGRLKQILVLPLLPLKDIHNAFKYLKDKITSFFEYQFESPYQNEQLNKFFDSVEENYYGNEEKMKKICKYGKSIRGTNLIEASHGGFNKSLLTPKHATVSHTIYGLKVVDLQYRALAVEHERKGVLAFPKKKNTEQEREKNLQLYYDQLEKNIISTEQFLELSAELWIHKKYYVMVQAATKVVEAEGAQEAAIIEDLIDAIFVNEEAPSRVRKMCKKYYGDEWEN